MINKSAFEHEKSLLYGGGIFEEKQGYQMA